MPTGQPQATGPPDHYSGASNSQYYPISRQEDVKTERDFWDRVNDFDLDEAIFEQVDYECVLEAEPQQMVALEALREMVNGLDDTISGLKEKVNQQAYENHELRGITENLA